MKFSIRSLAKTSMFLSIFALSSSLQANEETFALENLEQIELRRSSNSSSSNTGANRCKPDCSLDNAKVLVSEELWRTFVIKLKDALELNAFGFNGNELPVVQRSLFTIATDIDKFITLNAMNNDNFSVRTSLIQITFNLYAYNAALQANNPNPTNLENILQDLQDSTDQLVINLIARLRIREVKSQAYIRLAVEQWLFSTKNLVQDFVYANATGEWDGLFVDFNDSVNLFQIVGGIVGKYKGCEHDLDDLSVTSDLFSSSNS